MKTNFLDMVKEPKDIRLLNKEQLGMLADEIREIIVNTVADTGGHLGSSLGVVELAIALHYVFDSPRDKIIWDVGHQSYPHKLLTGRKEKFNTLRSYKGLSGFPKIKESVHDAFGTGHSSTSISAALGIAKARDLKKENNHVIAVIGDGALTGGMAFEGLNNAGHLKSKLIVILNDNEMSISKNVGALSNYIQDIVANPQYADMRKSLEKVLKKLPMGNAAAQKAGEFEDTMRAVLSPGMMFKQLGFKYYGPIDGHDIGKIVNSLRNVKNRDGPVLLHIKTKKGKGYSHAEHDKTKFHGIGCFDVESGEKIGCSKEKTFTDAFSKSILKIAEKDKKIVAITAAMCTGTGLEEFSQRFPDRFFDVGIAEQHAVTFAAGLASQGFKPVFAVYSSFLQRAYDQIVHDVCLQNLPVIFAIDRSGLVGEDGATHHGVFDISYLRHIPNLIIMAPKDDIELENMLEHAVTLNSPVAIRYPRGCNEGKFLQHNEIKTGCGEILRNGKSVAVIAIGNSVYPAFTAAIESKADCTVINARFVKPLDEKMIIDAAKKHKSIIIVEDNSLAGGFGSAVIELLAEKHINANVERIGIPDRFIEHGKVTLLRKEIETDKDSIKKKIKEMV